MAADSIAIHGRGRLLPGGTADAATVTFADDGFTLAIDADVRVAAYRDLATIAVQEGSALIVLGSDTGAERILLDQFGSAQGQLVRELRERRLRQRLGDALITVAAGEPVALVEYDDGSRQGVAQLAYDPWGAVIAPLDERLPWIRIRRSRIEAVRPNEGEGTVEVDYSGGAGGAVDAGGEGGSGGLAAGGTGAGSGDGSGPSHLRLLGLGRDVRVHADRLAGLRTAAHADAGRMIATLIPDAAYGARQEAARLLVDGNPATPADLPGSWADIEAGVLVEPTFASSYAGLRAKAGDLAELRSIAMSPMAPGADEARSWFLVPLPGNLVALELVSSGAHATYLFRVQPRAAYAGGRTDPAAVAIAVRDISEGLVDSRFLREPLALPDDQLRQPAALRYRLALAALPSLATARARFVARIVHRDDRSWAAALDDLIAWHAAARDDSAVWPGRAAQEAEVEAAAAADSGAGEAGPTDPTDPAGQADGSAPGPSAIPATPTRGGS